MGFVHTCIVRNTIPRNISSRLTSGHFLVINICFRFAPIDVINKFHLLLWVSVVSILYNSIYGTTIHQPINHPWNLIFVYFTYFWVNVHICICRFIHRYLYKHAYENSNTSMCETNVPVESKILPQTHTHRSKIVTPQHFSNNLYYTYTRREISSWGKKPHSVHKITTFTFCECAKSFQQTQIRESQIHND